MSPKIKKCAHCSKDFEYIRKSKKFCSTSCRVMSSQKKTKNELLLKSVQFSINELAISIRHKNETMPEDIDSRFRAIKRSIDNLQSAILHAQHNEPVHALGKQVMRHCAKCGQGIFGFEDNLPGTCDFCSDKNVLWVDTSTAINLGKFKND